MLMKQNCLYSFFRVGRSAGIVAFLLGAAIFCAGILASCGEGGQRVRSTEAFVTKSPTEPVPKGDDKSAYIVAVSAVQMQLRTSGTGSNECTDVLAVVKTLPASGEGAEFENAAEGSNVAERVEVFFTVSGKSGQKDHGAVYPEKVETNALGEAKAKYCAGREEGKVFVSAQAGVTIATTSDIEASSIPSFRFSWKDEKEKSFARRVLDVRSQEDKLAELLASGAVDTETMKPINLSLKGGGSDCSFVEFEMTRDGVAAAGEKLRFQTQEDVPVGVKLATREGLGVSEVNKVTGKKFAYYDGISNADGVFLVPVCAGTLPGNIILSATYTASDGKAYDARSPLVVMAGGVASYAHISLTYDAVNARVVPADSFTNTQKTLPFIARLGTVNDGAVLRTYPLALIAEVGKLVVDDNGFPNEKGEVKFTYESLNLRGGRPYRVYPSLPDITENSTTGPVACDPLQFPALADGVGTPYWQLARNWRSTLVYYVRGAESYRVNGAGQVFDPAKAFGFWDVNQNGTYDGNGNNDTSIDKITAIPSVPAGRSASSFNQVIDSWFIDLPSPFVDSNESGTYDLGEQLVGDEYVAPNGKYDENSYIWKSLSVPLYLGATAYSIQHSQISSTVGGVNAYVPSRDWVAYNLWLTNTFAQTQYTTNIATTGIESQLFGRNGNIMQATGLGEQDFWSYIHAHDKCGNPIPGGTKLTLNYVVRSKADVGSRPVQLAFFVQPHDSLREASKRLLVGSGGQNEVVMNADILEHPAAVAGFPVEFRVKVAPCENRCSGDLLASLASDPPRYCSSEQGEILFTVENAVTVKQSILFDSVFETRAGVSSSNPCGCVAGATRKGSVCACPTGQSVNGAGTACELPSPPV